MIRTQEEYIFQSLAVGPMGNLVYFIGDPLTNKVAVVDPAWETKAILKTAEKHSWQIVAVLLTHGHHDHINALPELLKTVTVPVYISSQEAAFYRPDCPNLHFTVDHAKIKVGNIDIECLYTPGHTPGCQCFRIGNRLMTGDTLFIDGCGRCDLPGGDPQTMIKTLIKLKAELPDDTIIYPGHSYGRKLFDTFGSQKITNPYLVAPDEIAL